MLSLSSLSAFSQSIAARVAPAGPIPAAARDAAVRAAPPPGVSAVPPSAGRPAPRGSLLNLSV